MDGVRALAVTAVLLFHGGVAWLPGGFLGVDAFFVLSGFLITSLLLAEHAATGRIHLGRFWLRRARRLLPALLLVLLFVVALFPGRLSTVELSLLRGDALAALFYVANWRMIYRGGGDYFAQTSAPSPLQHTWSLGIEEQFYLIWPLVVAVVLAAVAVRALRGTLLALCLLGVTVSVLLAAALHDPLAVNRAYYGTDTRAQALLIGCALAVLLLRVGREEAKVRLPAGAATQVPPVRLRPRLSSPARVAWSVAALAGLAFTGWLWSTASGVGPFLYQGGLTLGGLAVAAVLGQVVLIPNGPIARVLGLAPLVWLGRISYGVYLWHWPLFQLLNAQRTGLTGGALLATRLTATIAVSILSYFLIEQPIRTGRWPLGSGGRIRISPAVASVGSALVVAATATVLVVATVPRQRPSVLPIVDIPTAPVVVPSAEPELPTPMARPGRAPGTEPRIAFFGDSVSWTLGFYMQEFPGLSISTHAVQGCGIARLPDIEYIGEPHTNYPGCHLWERIWQEGVNNDDPDLAVILLDRWELMDRRLGEEYMHVGQPMYDAYLTAELELALSTVGARGAHIVLLTAPYTRRWERPDGTLYPEDDPRRVDAWNRLLRRVAARYPDTVTLIDLNRRVCPDGEFTWSIDGLQIRSDGLHFTPEGVQEWIAPWLVPQLARLAVLGPAGRLGPDEDPMAVPTPSPTLSPQPSPSP